MIGWKSAWFGGGGSTIEAESGEDDFPEETEWKLDEDFDGWSITGKPGISHDWRVIRDNDGLWLGGFALNIGIYSAPLRNCGEYTMVFSLPGTGDLGEWN